MTRPREGEDERALSKVTRATRATTRSTRSMISVVLFRRCCCQQQQRHPTWNIPHEPKSRFPIRSVAHVACTTEIMWCDPANHAKESLHPALLLPRLAKPGELL